MFGQVFGILQGLVLESGDVQFVVPFLDLAHMKLAEPALIAPVLPVAPAVGVLAEPYGEFIHTGLGKDLQMIELMVASTTRLTEFFTREMAALGRGKVLNVCSIGSFTPGPLDAVYQAAKAYMLSFSEVLHEELRGTGVTVTALCPGATETEFARRANMSETRLFKGFTMSAASVARIGFNAAMKGKRCEVAGVPNKLLVLAIPFLPKSIVLRITKYLLSTP